MKRQRLAKILIAALVLSLVSAAVFAISASADDTAAPEVISMNVAYSDNFALMYAVDAATVAEAPVTLEVFTELPAEGVTAEGKYTSSETETVKIDGVDTSVYVFTTRGVAAKDMADLVYVRATDAKGNVGEVVRYSVGEYLNERLLTEGISEAQRSLYTDALAYGSAAQEVLAPDEVEVGDYAYFRVEGGSLPDGYVKGIYPNNRKITVTPTSVDESRVLYGFTDGANVYKVGESFFPEISGVLTPLYLDQIEHSFEDGALPSTVTSSIKNGSAGIVDIERDGVSGKALKLSTVASSNDNLYFSKTFESDGAAATVFESDVYIEYGSVESSLQFILYDSNGKEAYLNVITCYNTTKLQMHDYSNASSSGTNRVDSSNLALYADTDSWFRIRIEYIYGGVDTVRINTYINGALIYSSTHYYGRTSLETQSVLPASNIAKVGLVPYGGTVANVWFDNTSLCDVKLEDTHSFEGLTEIPSGVTTSGGESNATTGLPAAFEIINDKELNSDVLRFGMDLNRGSYVKVAKTTNSVSGNARVFEADLKITNLGGYPITYIYLQNAGKDVYVLELYVTQNGIRVRDCSTPSASTATYNVLGYVPLSEWFNLRIEYYSAENLADARILTYVNNELIFVSNNLYTYSGADYSSINGAMIQCYSTSSFDVLIDNIGLYAKELPAPPKKVSESN